MLLHVLGDPAAVELCSAVDLEAVPLDDKGKLHLKASFSRAFSRFPKNSKSFSMTRVFVFRVSASIFSLLISTTRLDRGDGGAGVFPQPVELTAHPVAVFFQAVDPPVGRIEDEEGPPVFLVDGEDEDG
jgi:hypothetical protein